jgi:hypothetical protein
MLDNSTRGSTEMDPSGGNLPVARVPGNSASTDPFAVFELSDSALSPSVTDQHVMGDFFTGIGANGIGYNPVTDEMYISTVKEGHRVFFADADGVVPADATVLLASDVTAGEAVLRGGGVACAYFSF